jgi:TolB-like protein/Tfp pilus assembly protein PilF
MLLTPGRPLGPYEIIGPLGTGGMGEVYRAHDPRLGRDVALKVLPATTANDPAALERFTREARAVAALNHPHIVTIYSTEEVAGVRFLTMELIEGRTLDRAIPAGGVSLAQFFDVTIAIADALAAAHQKQILHRDLKPGNVMLTDTGRVKVLDFGLARTIDVVAAGSGDEATRAALTSDNTILGTTGYMSPEQIEAKPLDARSDLFALGVVIYELLAGERPFRGDSSPAVMAAVIKDRPERIGNVRSDVPAALSLLVARCLEKDPRDRPQSAQEVLLELKALRTAWESGALSAGAKAPARRPSGKMLAIAAAVVIVAGLATAGWLVLTRRTTVREERPTVAVLPFADMSEGKESYFADGVSEDILNVLSRVPELRVTSRSSAFSFKGKNVAVSEIAQRLHVGHVLEGSIRRSGNAVRITANLIDVRNDTPVWSETYDRTLDDVVAVQDEIAYAVARQLRRTLTMAPRPRKVNGRAYDLYLQATDVARQARRDRYEEVQRLLKEAVGIDPSFSMAWAVLGTSYMNAAVQGGSNRPTDELVALARDAASRAVAADPNNAWSYTLLSTIASDYDKDLPAAGRALERALALAPDDSALLLPAATFVVRLGRISEAVAIREYALTLDPLSPFGQFNMAVTYLNAERYDDAIAAARRSLAISPHRTVAHYLIGNALLSKHDAAGALAEYQQEPSENWKAYGLPLAFDALGRKEEADAALAFLIANYHDDSAYNIAQIYAMRGDADHAFTWLDTAIEVHDGGLGVVPFDPLVAHLHGDPRWMPFLRKIGKTPEQLAAVKFTFTIPGA